MIKEETQQYKKSSVYTRTGDKGTSALFNGVRSAKSEDVFNALGNVDELNAFLGVAVEHCKVSQNGLTDYIHQIQSVLFDIGTAIATPLKTSSEEQLKRARFDGEQVHVLEKWIDKLDHELPPLKNFILPGGGLSATHLHLCRTVCRRAERSIVVLANNDLVHEDVAIYINRLSDFLFVSARYASMKEGQPEVIYKKPSK